MASISSRRPTSGTDTSKPPASVKPRAPIWSCWILCAICLTSLILLNNYKPTTINVSPVIQPLLSTSLRVTNFSLSRAFWVNGCLINVNCSGHPNVPPVTWPMKANFTLICQLYNMEITFFDFKILCHQTRLTYSISNITILAIGFVIFLVIVILLKKLPSLAANKRLPTTAPSWRRPSMTKMTVIYILMCLHSGCASPTMQVKASRYKWLCLMQVNCSDVYPTYFSRLGKTYNFSSKTFEISPQSSPFPIYCIQDSYLKRYSEVDPRDYCNYPPTPSYVLKKATPWFVAFLSTLVVYCWFPEMGNKAVVTLIPAAMADDLTARESSSTPTTLLFALVLMKLLLKSKPPVIRLWLISTLILEVMGQKISPSTTFRYNVLEGDNCTLASNIERGHPSWFILYRSKMEEFQLNNRSHYTEDGSLVISNLELNDSGTYFYESDRFFGTHILSVNPRLKIELKILLTNVTNGLCEFEINCTTNYKIKPTITYNHKRHNQSSTTIKIKESHFLNVSCSAKTSLEFKNTLMSLECPDASHLFMLMPLFIALPLGIIILVLGIYILFRPRPFQKLNYILDDE